MAIALVTSNEKTDIWLPLLEEKLNAKIHVWPNITDKAAITHAIVSAPEPGSLIQFPNLEYIHSLWAGLEHITNDPTYPKHVPIIRMVDIGLTQGMQEYVTAQVFKYHLHMDKYLRDQKNNQWAPIEPPLAQNRTVGFMGLGKLGAECAKYLHNLGFNICGWSKNPKSFDYVQTFHGSEQFKDFLSQTEILVNLLPHTAETVHLLNAETLKYLPKGAYIINPGRGTIFNDEGLISMLDIGHIAHVTLDVFHEEPLKQTHPFWKHDKVHITPHIASVTRVETGAQTVTQNIQHLLKTGNLQDLSGVMNPAQGY